MSLEDAVLKHLGLLVVQDNAPLGLVLDGRYDVHTRVARGGMGDVFRADDLRLGRSVAIKTLAAELSKEEWAERFRDEVRTMTRIDHPGIVPVHDLGRLPDGRLYYAMAFVEGLTFGELLRQGSDLRRMVRILIQVSSVVQQAHDRGVIHRDLKPSNIMVGANEQVYVLDWGIAGVVDDLRITGGTGIEAGTGRTATGAVLGTLEYMAPEQATGERAAIDARSDVFALGACLYETLTGRPPRSGGSAQELLKQAAGAAVRSARTLAPSVPKDLDAIARKALSRGAGDRYTRARELGDDLRRWLEGDPVQARAASVGYAAFKWAAKRKGVVASVLGGLVLAGGVAAAVIPPWRREVLQRAEARRQLEAEREQRAAAQKAVEDARRHVSRGNQLLEEAGQLHRDLRRTLDEVKAAAARAEQEFKLALECEPGEPEACLGLSRASVLTYRRKEALEWLDRALASSQNFLPAYVDRLALGAEAYEKLRHRGGAAVSDENAEARALRERLESDLSEVERIGKDVPERQYAQGMIAFAKGSYERAAELLGEWLRTNPGDPKGHHGRGHALLHLGRYADAAAEFSDAIAARPRDTPPWALRSLCRSNLGEHGAALKDATQMVEIWADADAYAVRARAKRMAGDRAGALADYDKSLELGKDQPMTWTERAGLRKASGDLSGAASDLERALLVDPDFAPAYSARARLSLAAGRWDDALADCERAKRLDSTNNEPYLILGEAYRGKSDFEQSILNYTKAIDLAPRNQSPYVDRGNVRAAAGQLDLAIADYSRAMELAPLDFIPVMNRAFVRRKSGDLPGAQEDADRAVELNPKSANAYAIRADIHRDRGLIELAVADLTRSLELEPGQRSALFWRAQLLEKTDREGAIRDYSRVLELWPRDLSSLLNRGLLRQAKRDVDGAAEDFQAALTHAPVGWRHREETLQHLEAAKRAGGRIREARSPKPKFPMPPEEAQAAVKAARGDVTDPPDALLAEALKGPDGTPEQFVLLRGAALRAARAGNLPMVYGSLAALQERYAVERLSFKEALVKDAADADAAGGSPEALLELQGDILREAVQDDAYSILEEAGPVVEKLAKGSKRPAPAWVLDLLADRAELGARHKAARPWLERPGSGDGEVAGRYAAFAKGDWDQGLPWLARSAPAPLKWVADRDLKNVTDPREQMEIGDAWRDLAGHEKTRTGAAWLLCRARRWYDAAAARAPQELEEGLRKRLESLPSSTLVPADLLRRIVPGSDVVAGTWELRGTVLTNRAVAGFDRLEIPYEPAEEYDLAIEVERQNGPHAFVVGLATSKAQFNATFDGWDGKSSGLDLIDREGGGSNETAVRGKVLLPTNQSTTILCAIRRSGVKVFVNGERLIDWRGNFDRLSVHPNVAVRNTRGLFLGSWSGAKSPQPTAFVIRRIEVLPLSGPGRWLR